jgi:hypothetical protein
MLIPWRLYMLVSTVAYLSALAIHHIIIGSAS